MTKEDRIIAFKKLGNFLQTFTHENESVHEMELEIRKSQSYNNWFTKKWPRCSAISSHEWCKSFC